MFVKVPGTRPTLVFFIRNERWWRPQGNIRSVSFVYTFVSNLALYTRQNNYTTTDELLKPVFRRPPWCLRSTPFPVISITIEASNQNDKNQTSVHVRSHWD